MEEERRRGKKGWPGEAAYPAYLPFTAPSQSGWFLEQAAPAARITHETFRSMAFFTGSKMLPARGVHLDLVHPLMTNRVDPVPRGARFQIQKKIYNWIRNKFQNN